MITTKLNAAMNIDFFAMAWQNSGMHWNTLVWCARDNEQYLKHYYGENVMHYGVSHDGFTIAAGLPVQEMESN